MSNAFRTKFNVVVFPLFVGVCLLSSCKRTAGTTLDTPVQTIQNEEKEKPKLCPPHQSLDGNGDLYCGDDLEVRAVQDTARSFCERIPKILNRMSIRADYSRFSKMNNTWADGLGASARLSAKDLERREFLREILYHPVTLRKLTELIGTKTLCESRFLISRERLEFQNEEVMGLALLDENKAKISAKKLFAHLSLNDREIIGVVMLHEVFHLVHYDEKITLSVSGEEIEISGRPSDLHPFGSYRESNGGNLYPSAAATSLLLLENVVNKEPVSCLTSIRDNAPYVAGVTRDAKVGFSFKPFDITSPTVASDKDLPSCDVGDLDLDGVNDIVAGSPAGMTTTIRSFNGMTHDQLNTPVGNYQPYSTFRGGASVAIGDFDADGQNDVLSGAGPGGGPHVIAYSGRSNVGVIHSFFPFHSSRDSGLYVAAADLDRDGYSDMIYGLREGESPLVRANSGENRRVLRDFWAYDHVQKSATCGNRVAAGDFNHDGYVDIVTVPGPNCDGLVKVFSGYGNVIPSASNPQPRPVVLANIASPFVLAPFIPRVETGFLGGGGSTRIVIQRNSSTVLYELLPNLLQSTVFFNF